VSFDTKDEVTYISSNKFFLLPPHTHQLIQGVKVGIILLWSLKEIATFCECLDMNTLFKGRNKNDNSLIKPPLKILNINPLLNLYIKSLILAHDEGIECPTYLEHKIKELLMLMRFYYTQDSLADFFLPLFEQNSAFRTSLREKETISNLSIGQFAEENHSSRSTFHRNFKKEMGTTPVKWKTEERIKKIYHELKITDKPLKQVSEECGFSTVTYFNDFCKKHFGKTPGQIRQIEN
jgi:AraC-like DNA-binding protein